jgi:hypothetical protein
MQYWNIAYTQEDKVKKNTESNSSVEISLIRRALSVYAEAFTCVDAEGIKARESPDQSTARMGLVSQNFNTLMTSIGVANAGYYIQSLILLRNVFENWLAFWYLAKYPVEAEKWLNPNAYRPSIETIRKKIDHPSKEDKQTSKTLYHVLSHFAHTDPVAILERLEQRGNESIMKVGVRYEKKDFSTCCQFIVFWIDCMLEAISYWIAKENTWHSRNKEIRAEIETFLTFDLLKV